MLVSCSLLVTICYLAAPMSKPKTTQRTAATSDLDPAKLAELKILQRQRELANRKLLKRRQKKSGQ